MKDDDETILDENNVVDDMNMVEDGLKVDSLENDIQPMGVDSEKLFVEPGAVVENEPETVIESSQ